MRMKKTISRLLMLAACLAVAVPSAAQSQYQSTFELGIGYTRPATENMDMVSLLLQADEFFLETGIGLRTNAGQCLPVNLQRIADLCRKDLIQPHSFRSLQLQLARGLDALQGEDLAADVGHDPDGPAIKIKHVTDSPQEEGAVSR